MDRGSPKHVEFYSKNKFEKLVHLVGFIIRIYHDTRSPERQILLWVVYQGPVQGSVCFSIQGHRKRWTGFETAITYKMLDGFTRLSS